MNEVIKGPVLYEGKAKTIYSIENDPERVILKFRDDTSAFNGVKLERLPNKGAINNQLNAFIMTYLANHGVPTHFEKMLSPTESVVRHLTMIPIESVVRNKAAGNLAKRLGIPEGQDLNPPVQEFFLKNDALNDPMINESEIRTFNWATEAQTTLIKKLSSQVNLLLLPLFEKANLFLVDFKLEFGVQNGVLYLGDEWSPDGCRLWDMQSLEKFDKDRFRRDLGGVIEHYLAVGERLGVSFALPD